MFVFNSNSLKTRNILLHFLRNKVLAFASKKSYIASFGLIGCADINHSGSYAPIELAFFAILLMGNKKLVVPSQEVK
jgi:hypothetical protein